MVVFVSIVLFCTYVKLILCDLCDPNHGSEGAYDCVHMPKYNGYQWAVCLSSHSLKTHTSGYMDCHGSAFCWLPCTQSVNPNIEQGHVAHECICDPTENERRKRSLLAEGGKMEVTVSPVCYIPAMESNCQWYSSCLESHSPCEENDFHYAISYGKAICSIFLESFNSFSEDGKSWIMSSQKCIEDRLRSVLMPNDTSDCNNVHNRAYKAHTDCYLRQSNPGFCNLQHVDQMKIYWSIKQVYQNAFSEYFDEGMAEFRTCLRNDVYMEQIEYVFYVEKNINKVYEVDEKDFAMALAEKFAFSSHGVDWDVDLNMYNRSRSKRDTDFSRSKKYQPIRVLVSRKQVDLVDRSRRSPNQNHLRKTDESEYDKGFLENLDKNIINGLKEENFQVLDIDVKKRKKRTIGLLRVTAGVVWNCFLRKMLFKCIRSVLAIHTYRQGVLPDTPEDIDPKFILHTRNTSDIYLSFSDTSSLTHFYPSKSTYIIIHGFLNSGDEEWIQNMKSHLLDKKDANVIIVDWEKGAKEWYHYEQAAVNTEVVGTILALLVESLEHHWGASKTHIHIIGHSLGAHVAGFAGNAHKETRYQRITGMDPAGPFFRDKNANARLDETDAHFVDVIHTNGGYMGYLDLGYLDPVGHLDFYPNGGENQPGCKTIICSHSRAHQFFTESILSDQKFKAWECDSLDQCKSGDGIDTTRLPDNRMGFYTENAKRNKMYYLETNKKSPYSKP